MTLKRLFKNVKKDGICVKIVNQDLKNSFIGEMACQCSKVEHSGTGSGRCRQNSL